MTIFKYGLFKKSKEISFYGYIFLNQLLLFKCEDIETNLGPMLHFLYIQVSVYERQNKTYFIVNTIKLQLEYQHQSKFALFINPI